MPQFYPNPVGIGTRTYTGALTLTGLAQTLGFTLTVNGNIRQNASSGPLTIIANNTSTVGGDLSLFQMQASSTAWQLAAANTNAGQQITNGPAGAQVVLSVTGGTFVMGTNGIARSTINSVGNWTINPPDNATNTVTINAIANAYALMVNGSAVNAQSFGLSVQAGTTIADVSFKVVNQANTNVAFIINGDGSFGLGGDTGNAAPYDIQGDGAGNAFVFDTGGSPFVIGYRESPYIINNSNYTFTLADRGKTHNRTSANGTITWTIPTNAAFAFPTGTVINLFGFPGANAVTLTTAGGVGLSWVPSGTVGNRTLGPGFVATLYQGAINNWYIWGTGIS